MLLKEKELILAFPQASNKSDLNSGHQTSNNRLAGERLTTIPAKRNPKIYLKPLFFLKHRAGRIARNRTWLRILPQQRRDGTEQIDDIPVPGGGFELWSCQLSALPPRPLSPVKTSERLEQFIRQMRNGFVSRDIHRSAKGPAPSVTNRSTTHYATLRHEQCRNWQFDAAQSFSGCGDSATASYSSFGSDQPSLELHAFFLSNH